ncbi:MAG: hypothetical protein K2X81_18785 [Candidatus Obscuribacterales bacterium]|nr:hypothetical protein [Candidatus Obscuribacterales bacterium]
MLYQYFDKLLRASSASLLFSCIFAALTTATMAADAIPNIPSEGKKLQDFVPAGWQIFKQADGDLNGDAVKDYAFILVKAGDNPESGCLETPTRTARLVIVLHGSSNGQLKKACVSKGAIMQGDIGNDFALLVVDIAITKGNLIISNGNGATSIEQFESKYRYQKGKYELIGLTDNSGYTRDDAYYTEDVNLNNSYTETEARKGSKTTSSEAFYWLRAGLVTNAPKMDGTFREEEWPGLAIKLKTKSNIAKGANAWKGPADLSAEIRAIHTDTDLYICAKTTHKTPNEAASLRLFGNKKKIFSPVQSKTYKSSSGEYIEAKFPIKALKPAIGGNYGRIAAKYQRYDLSVEIVEPASPSTPEMILSTSCTAEKRPGFIGLPKSPWLPTLESWDWANRDQ